jgi:hypothetical protein
MKIIMSCSVSPDFAIKYKKCLDSQKKYCQKYSYDYVIDDLPLLPNQTNKEWTWKKHYTLEKFRNSHDVFVSIDADCEITDKTPALETVIDSNDIYFVNGISKRPNAGFLIVKNTKLGNYFHDELMKRRNLPVPNNCKAKGGGDNGHVIWILSEIIQGKKELPLNWNCSQPDFMKEAYIIHYTNSMRKYFEVTE